MTIDLHATAVQGSVQARTQFEDYEVGFIGIEWFLKNI
jgi:hypothetical protein